MDESCVLCRSGSSLLYRWLVHRVEHGAPSSLPAGSSGARTYFVVCPLWWWVRALFALVACSSGGAGSRLLWWAVCRLGAVVSGGSGVRAYWRFGRLWSLFLWWGSGVSSGGSTVPGGSGGWSSEVVWRSGGLARGVVVLLLWWVAGVLVGGALRRGACVTGVSGFSGGARRSSAAVLWWFLSSPLVAVRLVVGAGVGAGFLGRRFGRRVSLVGLVPRGPCCGPRGLAGGGYRCRVLYPRGRPAGVVGGLSISPWGGFVDAVSRGVGRRHSRAVDVLPK